MGISLMNITFQLMAQIKAKPRPRLGHRGCYMPPKYTEWEQSAVLDLLLQAKQLKFPFPINFPVKLTIRFIGKNYRGDLDNLIKSVSDILVKANILSDDKLTIVQSINASWEKGHKPCCIICIDKIE